jgi:hypothetical protein
MAVPSARSIRSFDRHCCRFISAREPVPPRLTFLSRQVTIVEMALIRGLFWLALFLFFTFSFVVLFEYGTHDFLTGFQKEFQRVKEFVQQADKAPKSKK